MKQLIALALAFVLLCAAACAEIDLSGMRDEELTALREQLDAELMQRNPDPEPDVPHVPVSVNPSPDKYTCYIQDYVGRNVAGIGYTSIGGDRLEKYGRGYLKLILVTEDGGYLDIEDEEALKRYVVAGQSLAPNTEMKLAFETDSDGEEFDYLVNFQSIVEIDLLVRRVDGETAGEAVGAEMVPIDPSPDKYTCHIKNYVGKNLASFGYTSYGEDRMDEYGKGRVKFTLVTDDGAFIDPTDNEQLKEYYVTAQDVAPNSEMRLTFMTDSDGEEYSNLVDSQTYENITLYVHRLPEAVVAAYATDKDGKEE